MGIILGEVPDTHQTMEGTRQFMAMHQPQLPHPYRKIPVTVDFSLVNNHAARTVHGLNGVIHIVDLGKIHVFFIMVPVTGFYPKLTVEDNRCFYFLIPPFGMFFPPKVFQGVSYYHAFGVEKWKPRSFFVDAK